MKVIKSENIVCVDVDQTLVDEGSTNLIHFDYYGQPKTLSPIHEHIDLVKTYHQRGFVVWVWSGNGYIWANEVIMKLGLEDYVDYISTKPSRYIDDLPAENWMGTRIYLRPQK